MLEIGSGINIWLDLQKENIEFSIIDGLKSSFEENSFDIVIEWNNPLILEDNKENICLSYISHSNPILFKFFGEVIQKKIRENYTKCPTLYDKKFAL